MEIFAQQVFVFSKTSVDQQKEVTHKESVVNDIDLDKLPHRDSFISFATTGHFL